MQSILQLNTSNNTNSSMGIFQDAFDSFGETIVKTMVMTVGELDYMATLVDNEGKSTTGGAPYVPYPDLSYVFIFFFVMTMPIVLMNLLVRESD